MFVFLYFVKKFIAVLSCLQAAQEVTVQKRTPSSLIQVTGTEHEPQVCYCLIHTAGYKS